VRRLHHTDLRFWLNTIVVLGGLLGGPLWVELAPDGEGNRWMGAGMFVVGALGAIGLWRFLAASFPADEVDELIPAHRQARETKERLRQRTLRRAEKKGARNHRR